MTYCPSGHGPAVGHGRPLDENTTQMRRWPLTTLDRNAFWTNRRRLATGRQADCDFENNCIYYPELLSFSTSKFPSGDIRCHTSSRLWPDFVELSRRRRQTNTIKFSCFDRRVASKPASVTRACFSRVGTGLSRSQFAKLLKEALRSHRKRRTKYAALTVSRSERRKTRKKPSCISCPQETILKTLNKRINNKKQLIINIMSNFSQAISYLLERYMA